MEMSLETILIIVILLLYVDIMLICRIVINKAKREQQNESVKQNDEKLLNLLNGGRTYCKGSKLFFNYAALKQTIKLEETFGEDFKSFILNENIVRKYIKRLKSFFKVRRIEAAVYLGIIASEDAREALENAMLKEKDFPVKLYMANALADIHNPRSIQALVSTLINAHKWYRNKVNLLIADFDEHFHAYIPNIAQREEIEFKELIVDFASVYISEYLKSYLEGLIESRNDIYEKLANQYEIFSGKCCGNCIYSKRFLPNGYKLCTIDGPVKSNHLCGKFKILPVSIDSIKNYHSLVYKAAEILAGLYFEESISKDYLFCDDIKLRNIAIKAIANNNSYESVVRLSSFLRNDETASTAVTSILHIIESNPCIINQLVNIFLDEKDYKVRARYAEVLSIKIDYFIMKLTTDDMPKAADVIKEVLLLGKASEIIAFLNNNRDVNIENRLIDIIKSAIGMKDELIKDFCTYLNDSILQKCGLERYEQHVRKKEEKKDAKLIKKLYFLIAIVVLVFPIIYILRHKNIFFTMPFIDQVKIYIIDFNYYLAFYSSAINLLYLILLGLSFVSVAKQIKLWNMKGMTMLFKKRMLPSISIIAPAFNEEKTIIESTNSLLNLKYPDYELIIMNDGSKDSTLDVLINYFELVRVDYDFECKLKTMPVRSIYMNHSIPKLIVVDKENGGKADSLNAGINISNKDYFCGIDADSLLEEDALLKLASQTLDEGVETPALGGNIFPINGCSVSRGLITEVRIPKNNLARFQTIEYMRAFMAGRLGWALINSLLIISGAFGLFRKERIIDIGGYLTSSGKYGKDTVGEDMELVVRIGRLMRELDLKYRVCYAFNANCWTEVPEDLKSLKRQRYRWHRGLIDILTFHRKVMFNPKYGRMGIIAMPYFFIFEVIGPLIEIQGYVMILLAFLLGLLNPFLAAMLFVTTILLGTLVSLSSLLIAEKNLSYFKYKDIAILILYSILENFGPRQLFSFWRVSGFFNLLKKPTGWGKLERKGFTNKNTGVTG